MALISEHGMLSCTEIGMQTTITFALQSAGNTNKNGFVISSK